MTTETPTPPPGAPTAAPGGAKPQPAPKAPPQPAPKAPPQPQAAPQPRPRGKPGRKSNAEREAMAAAASPAGAAEPPPAGGGEAPKARAKAGGSKPSDVDRLAEKLVMYHAILATFAKAPELAIGPEEARALASAGLDLAAEFDLEIGGRWAVVATFVLTAAGIYFPRVVIMSARMDAARKEAAKNRQPGPFPGAPTINPDGTPVE